MLSRDGKVNQGCKQFTWFESPQKLIAFVNDLKPNDQHQHYHEVIPNNTDCPVWMFFDIDRKSPEFADVNELLVETLQVFLIVLHRFLD